jgi:hypothetical protein
MKSVRYVFLVPSMLCSNCEFFCEGATVKINTPIGSRTASEECPPRDHQIGGFWSTGWHSGVIGINFTIFDR